ncbi:putative dihydroorotate oxidase [Diaporthe ampelina]|uniref:Putative dihydroorotate oxidase n=1 Tax=Diaporthe ampelina TaxID=1214573 RepID=A0A0G2FGM3_9PEZI|nr:putative dihydroorotate oxidase [Diaporthe ampelina]
MEINLSCPNIPDKPPPAYNGDSLNSYLTALQELASKPNVPRIPFGLKTPPYTHATEYVELFSALKSSAQQDPGGVCPVSFITATNTLGSCLVLTDPGVKVSSDPALPGLGIGGMAGAPLHPLALGNVRTINKMLGEAGGPLAHIQVIGVGGVLDHDGFKRMQAVGADIVGVGTGLGLKGVGVFDDILRGA